MGIHGPEDLHRAVTTIVAAGPPGGHLSVAITGGPRWDACVGHAQLFDAAGPLVRPLTVGHAHDLGSVTKIVGTTAMLAALASTGSVRLDDEIGALVPDLPPPVARATLRDLLTHRAGLWEWWPTYLLPGDPVDAVAALPLRYPPRTARHYSDLGFMLLGRAVEKVTGQSLPAAHHSLVADPAGTLGMTYAAPPPGHPAPASSFGDRIERRMILTGSPYPVTADASAFSRWRDQVLVGEVNDGNAFHSFGGAAGHAGLFGTADALHALGAALLSSVADGSPWPALREFLVPGPDPGQLLGFRSWVSVEDGCSATVVGHPGFPGIGFGILPRHGASIFLGTNRLHVAGEPAAFEPLWLRAVAAAHRVLHASGSAPDRPDRDPAAAIDAQIGRIAP